MSKINKIEKYNLQERTLALSAQGHTTALIAAKLTEELQGRDTISQPRVSVWLKRIRKERSEQTREQFQDFVKTELPTDLKALKEIEGWHLDLFRADKLKEHLKSIGIQDQKAEDIAQIIIADFHTRSSAAMKALKIIETKLRFAGVLEDDGGAGSAAEPVDLDQYRKPHSPSTDSPTEEPTEDHDG